MEVTPQRLELTVLPVYAEFARFCVAQKLPGNDQKNEDRYGNEAHFMLR